MPIFLYECPEGHETEFIKLKKREASPKFCEHPVYHGRRMDTCGLPLKKKKFAATNWKFTRGKNPNWPISDPEDSKTDA
jgi:hypothetical protein